MRRSDLSTRRDFLAAQGVALAAAFGAPRPTRAAAPPSDETSRALLDKAAVAARRGREFLKGLFDPAVELLPEYRGASVYWLYHDNYLAAKVLARSHEKLAAKITRAIGRHGVTASGKIEILFDEAPRGFPFRQYELTEVARVGERVIRTEVVKGGVFEGWRDYVDLLLLAAIFKASGNRDPEGARQDFAAAIAAWDGRGLRDRVTEKSGLYATYKLALALVAASQVNEQPSSLGPILGALLAQQADDGGWITDYDAQGKRVGLANAETTSLAVLAIDRCQATSQ